MICYHLAKNPLSTNHLGVLDIFSAAQDTTLRELVTFELLCYNRWQLNNAQYLNKPSKMLNYHFAANKAFHHQTVVMQLTI